MTGPAMHRGRSDEFSEDHITETVVLSQVSKSGHNPQPIKEPQTFEDETVCDIPCLRGMGSHALTKAACAGIGQSGVSEAACEWHVHPELWGEHS